MAGVRIRRPWAGVVLLGFALAITAGLLTMTVAGEPRVGILRGRVIDDQGRPIARAFVTVPTTVPDEYRHVRTDEDGEWRAPQTPVGYHEITAGRRGFSESTQESGSLTEGRTLRVPDIVLYPAHNSLNLSVNYPRTAVPGSRKHLTVNGVWDAELAQIHFAVYPYDLVRARLERSQDGQSFQERFLKSLTDSIQPLEQWDRAYRTSEMDGSFTGWPAIPTISEPGTYIVVGFLGRMVSADPVNITNLSVVVKRDRGSLLVWAADIKSGSPLKDTSVEVYTGSHKLLSGVTGEDGLWRSEFTGPESAAIIARSGKSVAMTGSYMGDYHFDQDQLLYTDRPIYRPGHTVHFKGIFRRWTGSGYQKRTSGNVEFLIRAPQGQIVARVSAVASDQGTAYGSWVSPEEAELGSYTVGVVFSGEADQASNSRFQASFAIEEYRKPEYAVAVAIPKPYYIRGQKIPVSVRANYYFGAPVANAEVTYTVYRSDWTFWDYDNEYESWFNEGDYGYDYGGYGEVVREGRGVTDDNGDFKTEIDTQGEEHQSRYVVEARVVDPTMKEVSASAGANVVPADFAVQPEPLRYVYRPGETVRFKIKTVDWDRRIVPDKPIDVVIERADWRGGKEIRRQVGTGSARTDAGGLATLSWKATAQGQLVFTFRAKDSAGRTAQAEAYVYVGTEAFWEESSSSEEALTIVPDKKMYQKGDTAHILIKSNHPSATLLLTVEGEKLYEARVVRTKGAAYMLDLPIENDYLPSVTLVCTLLADRQIQSQETGIAISPQDSLLTVKITSNKQRYQPGEKATYTIETLNASGHGVPAEVSLGVVDESIYALRNDSTPDIQKYFWGPRSNNVNTSNSLEDYYYGGLDKFENKVRKYFPDTAYWNPVIKTDSLGVATVSFTMPDSLTTWRATARAVTDTTAVGAGTQKVTVTKDLIVRLQVPRFFRQRDTQTLGAVVHNYTGARKKVSVRLTARGLKLRSGTVRSATVEANGTARVEFPVEVTTPGEATLLAEAITDDRSAVDRLQMSFPVYPHGARMFRDASGGASGEEGASVALSMDRDGQLSGAALRIDLTPSAAGAVIQALGYLATYPWGCVEQTVSSFVPDVLVQQALTNLGAPVDEKTRAELPKMIAHGLRKLREMQHSDGSFGWYSETDADVGMTAYALLGLVQAREAGVSIPSGMIESAASWLGRHMRQPLPPRPTAQDRPKAQPRYLATLEDRAYAVMALAASGGFDIQSFDALYAKRSEMSVFGVACLGMAASSAGRGAALAEIASLLEKRAKRSEGLLLWHNEQTSNYWSDYAATAMAMRVLSRAGRPVDALEPAARYLAERRSGGYWVSTRDTALCTLALLEHLERVQPVTYSANVQVNGRSVGTFDVTREDYFRRPKSFIIENSKLNRGVNRIVITKSGSGPLFWTANLSYLSSREDVPAQKGFFTVERNLLRVKLTRAGVGDDGAPKYTEDTQPVRGRIKVGEVVRVQIKIRGKGDASYVLVDNPLPSGFEVMHPEREWDNSYSGLEIHDEKVGAFVRFMSGAEREISFDVRAEVPGDLHVMPCQAYSMYQPLMSGSSSEDRLSVR
ncbi:MAG: carboxypeptidase regulatory-like domain-containing protein [Armatimonadetes bacterium]|nr:carboxypeptidase regulatory-like domain-containing protein [Armatimonadota bacterium]